MLQLGSIQAKTYVVVLTGHLLDRFFFFFGFEHRERAVDRNDIAAVIDGLRRPVDHRAGFAGFDDRDRRTAGSYLAIVVIVIVVVANSAKKRSLSSERPKDFIMENNLINNHCLCSCN